MMIEELMQNKGMLTEEEYQAIAAVNPEWAKENLFKTYGGWLNLAVYSEAEYHELQLQVRGF